VFGSVRWVKPPQDEDVAIVKTFPYRFVLVFATFYGGLRSLTCSGKLGALQEARFDL
jgi:hypothetical protein